MTDVLDILYFAFSAIGLGGVLDTRRRVRQHGHDHTHTVPTLYDLMGDRWGLNDDRDLRYAPPLPVRSLPADPDDLIAHLTEDHGYELPEEVLEPEAAVAAVQALLDRHEADHGAPRWPDHSHL